jgi:hypothetical protein
MCFYVDEYADFIHEKTVKCRKAHNCESCSRVIAVGETASNVRGKHDGRMFSFYMCELCERKRLSIAARELRHGCRWDEAWCPSNEVAEYAEALEPPLVLLEGTIKECLATVNAIYRKEVA